MLTRPRVGSSRKFRQRKKVVLPDARAADEHDRLVLPYGQADAAQDMVRAEVLLDVGRLEDHIAKRHHQRSPRAMRCSRRSWTNEKMMVRIQYTPAASSSVSSDRKLAVPMVLDAPEQLLDADERDQSRVLDHGDELVADGRRHDADGLRHDDAAHDAAPAHAQRQGRFALPTGTASMPARKISVR